MQASRLIIPMTVCWYPPYVLEFILLLCYWY